MADGLDLGTIIELANGLASTFKKGENGQSSMAIDPQKLGMVMVSFAGRQVMARLMARRQRQAAELDEAIAYLRQRAGIKPPKRKIGVLPLLVGGLGLGGAIYVALLKPEERTQLFKYLDGLANEISGLIGEIQGKPYSSDYEPKDRA